MSKRGGKREIDRPYVERALTELFESHWETINEWLERGSGFDISRGKDKLYVAERRKPEIVINLY